MKNILVPTDFSKCANNALTYAFEIAARTDAKLHLLHVVFSNEGLENNVYNAYWIDSYLEDRRRMVDKMIQRFKKNEAFSKITVSASVEIGFPIAETIRYSREHDTDLIVMGTIGATGLSATILGSNAAGVMTKSKIPVLTVPKKGTYRSHSNFAFATDFHLKLDEKSQKTLHEVLDIHHSGLNVVHVFEKPKEQPDEAIEQLFKKKMNGIKHQIHYLHNPKIVQAINDFVDSTDANVLVTVKHDHNPFYRLFYESVSEKLAHQARLPLLVLHD